MSQRSRSRQGSGTGFALFCWWFLLAVAASSYLGRTTMATSIDRTNYPSTASVSRVHVVQQTALSANFSTLSTAGGGSGLTSLHQTGSNLTLRCAESDFQVILLEVLNVCTNSIGITPLYQNGTIYDDAQALQTFVDFCDSDCAKIFKTEAASTAWYGSCYSTEQKAFVSVVDLFCSNLQCASAISRVARTNQCTGVADPTECAKIDVCGWAEGGSGCAPLDNDLSLLGSTCSTCGLGGVETMVQGSQHLGDSATQTFVQNMEALCTPYVSSSAHQSVSFLPTKWASAALFLFFCLVVDN